MQFIINLEFKTVPYDNLVDFAKTKIGCPVKELAYEIKSWEEFRDLYMEAQDEDINIMETILKDLYLKMLMVL